MELFNKEGHLTDEGLRAVVDGTLDEMGRLEASEHLSFCDSCLVRYTELLADDTLLVPEMPLTPTVLARVRRRAVRVFFNRYTRVAAVAAFAVVLWGTGVFNSLVPDRTIRQQEQPGEEKKEAGEKKKKTNTQKKRKERKGREQQGRRGGGKG